MRILGWLLVFFGMLGGMSSGLLAPAVNAHDGHGSIPAAIAAAVTSIVVIVVGIVLIIRKPKRRIPDSN